ncbi:hypothetical protein SLUN_33255 [Streptomyces lunaelactis]|uniref:WD40 repeat domain-containing protein n=1 Tax=Streptomyces lunaelactis TaxID=1535768 RepID=A0A2R4TB41_9ACTN|nr:hypothetical protein [Streptomyces lunaelactis]AVZ76350.1 hypothetical protein SLUN_33255 [Streptomyces lunaelactis]NUK85307.1 hypothetical protein [Streptomyces lunaelactis]
MASLTVGTGPLEGSLATVDHLGTVRLLSMEDGSPQGRTASGTSNITGLSALSDGTLLALDAAGRTHADRTRVDHQSRSGIEALLNDGPDEKQILVEVLQDHVGTAIATTVSSDKGIAVLGDASGTVRVFGDVTGAAALHEGRVTAVAALEAPLGGGATAPLLYSGGTDGTVRVWTPGHDPLVSPLIGRACGVVALDAAWSEDGPLLAVAWADGLVQLHCVEKGRHLNFRPGAPVRAVVVTPSRFVVIGLDEAIVRLAAHAERSDWSQDPAE